MERKEAKEFIADLVDECKGNCDCAYVVALDDGDVLAESKQAPALSPGDAKMVARAYDTQNFSSFRKEGFDLGDDHYVCLRLLEDYDSSTCHIQLL